MPCLLVCQDDWISLIHFSKGLGESCGVPWDQFRHRLISNNTSALKFIYGVYHLIPHIHIRSKHVSIKQHIVVPLKRMKIWRIFIVIASELWATCYARGDGWEGVYSVAILEE